MIYGTHVVTFSSMQIHLNIIYFFMSLQKKKKNASGETNSTATDSSLFSSEDEDDHLNVNSDHLDDVVCSLGTIHVPHDNPRSQAMATCFKNANPEQTLYQAKVGSFDLFGESPPNPHNQVPSNVVAQLAALQDLQKQLVQDRQDFEKEKQDMRKLFHEQMEKKEEQHQEQIKQLQNDFQKTNATIKALSKNHNYVNSKKTSNNVEIMVGSSSNKRKIGKDTNNGSKKQKTGNSAATVLTKKTSVSVN